MDLSGKTAIVTGASSGIGLEAAVKLARHGASVTLVSRDSAKGERALAQVRERAGSARVAFALCDFAVQKSVRALAADLLAKHPRIDILVNNAGTVSPSRVMTEDGVEMTFAVNHLGYFLLTTLLLDRLVASAPARIVNVSSKGHYDGDLDFDNLHFERGYFILRAYNRAKLANVLFTRELARRLAAKGVTANCLHPGMVATPIWSKAPWFARPFLSLLKRTIMVTPEQGGDRIVYLAASAEVEGKSGDYYDRDRPVRPSRLAQDDTLAARLWKESEALIARSA